MMGDEQRDGIEESDLHAFLDGALDPSRETAVREWLAVRPEEHERLARYAEQQLALIAARAEPDRPRLPVPLVRALERGLRRGLWRRRVARVAAMILMVAVGWGANDLLRLPVFAGLPAYAQEAANLHGDFGNQTAVSTSLAGKRPDDIRRWLSARLGEAVTLPELHRIGLELVGARVIDGEQGPMGQLFYEDALGRHMTLSLNADETLAPDRPTLAEYDGMEVGYWRNDDFALVVVSSSLPIALDKLVATIDGAPDDQGL